MRKSAFVRQLISILLLTALLSTVIVSFAAQDNCSHNWVYYGTRSIYVHNELTHSVLDQWIHKCTLCGAVRYVNNGNPGPPHPHKNIFQYDQHIDVGFHHYFFKCSVCNRPKTTTVACSGPPCVSPLSTMNLTKN